MLRLVWWASLRLAILVPMVLWPFTAILILAMAMFGEAIRGVLKPPTAAHCRSPRRHR